MMKLPHRLGGEGTELHIRKAVGEKPQLIKKCGSAGESLGWGQVQRRVGGSQIGPMTLGRCFTDSVPVGSSVSKRR